MAPESRDMDPTILLHRFRYHFGRGFITPSDRVLDLGCGIGYGVAMLSEVAKYVIGYDIDIANINTCNAQSKKDNNEFIMANLEDVKLKEAEVATSFEVIEHLYKPAKFIKKLKKKIKKFIIVSVPIGQTLIEVDGDMQVGDDPTHHSVFPFKEDLNDLFLDDDWGLFYGFQTGIIYMAAYYNRNQYED